MDRRSSRYDSTMEDRRRESVVELGSLTGSAEKYFHSVNPDSDLIITEAGTPRWRVTAYVDQNAKGWDAMVARGEVRVPSRPAVFRPPAIRLPHGLTSENLLDELRGEH